jgi:hypothetical protein
MNLIFQEKYYIFKKKKKKKIHYITVHYNNQYKKMTQTLIIEITNIFNVLTFVSSN